MSGPKGVHYEVVSPEEQRRRAIAAAKSSIRARRAELEMLAARADAWPAARGEVAQLLSSAPSDLGEDLDALQRHAEQLAQSISRAESTLARAREQAERQAIAAAISQITISIDDPGTTRTLAATPARAVETSTAERRLAALAALVATHPEAGPEPSRQLLGLQQRLGGLTDTQSAALLDATQHSIVREIERHRGERALAEAIGAVLRATDDLDDPDADELRRRLRTAPDVRAVRKAEHDLAELRRARQAAGDRSFVFVQVVEVLSEMGYEVDADDVPAGATAVVATHPSLPDHGLRLLFRTDDPSFYTSVVAFGNTSVLTDLAVENRTCEDLDAAQRELAGRGVDASFLHRRDAGTVPVQRTTRSADTAAKRRRAAQPKEQAL